MHASCIMHVCICIQNQIHNKNIFFKIEFQCLDLKQSWWFSTSSTAVGLHLTVYLRDRHVHGVDNIVADALSRVEMNALLSGMSDFDAMAKA